MTFIIQFSLLSCLSFLWYWAFIRHRSSLRARKLIMYCCLPFCFLITMLVPSQSENVTPQQVFGLRHRVTHTSILSYSPSIQELQDFCKCQHPHLGNRIAFELGLVHQVLEKYTDDFSVLYRGIVIFLLSILIVQIIYIVSLFQSSSHSGKFYKDIPILTSRRINSPASWGLFSKRIFWPSENFTSSGQEQDSILEHEYSHIKQNHSLEQLFFRVMTIFMWFNPAIFLIRKELRLIGECIADADGANVMQDRKGYATLLLNLSSVQQNSLIIHNFLQHPLSYRISYVLGRHSKNHRKSSRFIWYLLLGIHLQLVGNYYLLAPGLNQFITDHQLYVSMQEKINSDSASIYSCQECKRYYID